MRRLLQFSISILMLFCITSLAAQSVEGEVVWSEPRVEHIEGDIYNVEISVDIAEGWKIYDMREYVDGPNPTTLSFALPEGASLSGETFTREAAEVKWDAMFAQQIGFYEGRVTFVQGVVAPRGGEVEVNVEWMMCSDTSCMPPMDQSFTVEIPSSAKSSMWLVILEALLWGFAALLTPCVFPMVPLTISFFLKDGQRGRFAAVLYGLFIVALYTLPIAVIIMVTYLFGGDAVMVDIFNWVATHWLPNILFFVVFMIFAASFFGAFEITLPSSWVNRSDSHADRGSIVGVFFLALTLVLVSFSCTGPIVGSVLIKSVSGDVWQPIITMAAFSTAFALPFVVAALFPALLQRMPKSGGWLSSVKIVLGFLEIALGLKFLSVADQTYHWGLLNRELYLSIWIVVFALMGLYLLGKIRFYDGAKVESIGVGRLFLSVGVFSFVVYLCTGLWGAPLTALSGYLPPPAANTAVVAASQSVKFSAIDEAQSVANGEGKPLMLYFTGHGCVNCREMEQRVWSDPRVKALLDEDFVVMPMYMDDKREAAESEWITTSSGRVLKSVGRVNSYVAQRDYGVSVQPYYIILGRDGEELLPPRGYNLNIKEYVEFLKQAIKQYQTKPNNNEN